MITSPQFSFVSFNSLPGTVDYALPVYQNHDVAFQFKVVNDRPVNAPIKLAVASTSGILLHSLNQNASILDYRASFVGLTSSFYLESIAVGSETRNYNIDVQISDFYQLLKDDFGISSENGSFTSSCLVDIVVVARTVALGTLLNISLSYFWNQGYVSGNGVAISVPVDGCFKYALIDNGNFLLAVSNNIFKVVPESRYSSLIAYSCNESAFDFVYGAGQMNQIRLPVSLSKPSFPKTRTVYTRSDGSKQLLSATVNKEYELHTDQADEWFHERLSILLAHDNIVFDCADVSGGAFEVLESADYSVEWDEDSNIRHAPGKGKITAAKFGYSNSNCSVADNCCAPLFVLITAGPTNLLLGFTYPPNITRFTIYLQKVGSLLPSIIEINAATSYNLTGLDPASSYDISVASKCGGIIGAQTGTKRFSTI